MTKIGLERMIAEAHQAIDGLAVRLAETIAAADETEAHIATIASENFGPFPVQTLEENLTAIERGIFELRKGGDVSEFLKECHHGGFVGETDIGDDIERIWQDRARMRSCRFSDAVLYQLRNLARAGQPVTVDCVVEALTACLDDLAEAHERCLLNMSPPIFIQR